MWVKILPIQGEWLWFREWSDPLSGPAVRANGAEGCFKGRGHLVLIVWGVWSTPRAWNVCDLVFFFFFAPSHSLARRVSLSVRRASGSWEDSWSRLCKWSQVSQERSQTIGSFLSLPALLSVFFSWLHFCPAGWPFGLGSLWDCARVQVLMFYAFVHLSRTLDIMCMCRSAVIFSLPWCNFWLAVRRFSITVLQTYFPLKAVLGLKNRDAWVAFNGMFWFIRNLQVLFMQTGI